MRSQIYPPVSGLVFDMDGLLFDSERVVQRSWEWAGQKLGYEHFGSHIYHTIGFNVKRREMYFKENVSPSFPMEKFTDMTRKRYHDIIESEGLEKKPGAEEILKYASAQGYRIALATSSRREHASDMLKRQGLMEFFQGAVYGDMVSEGKPSPEIYRRACLEIQVEPRYALALEDSPAGIRSACSAGMRAIIIPDLVEPDAEILGLAWRRYDSLWDVLELLKAGEN